MDPVALVGHHASTAGIAVELGVVAVVGVLLGLVWSRGRHRAADRRRRVAEMRDDERR